MLKFPALKVKQHGKEIYTFKALGKDILSFASISRIKRDDEGNLQGYQRLEVTKHINEIANYLKEETSILANSIVIGFDSKVTFEPLDGNNDFGYICIPTDEIHGQIVDGQQRSTALQRIENENFEVAINAFITSTEEEHTEQFILINNTKPLPKGLIYELLPEIKSELPSTYKDKQLPNKLISILNAQEYSPFFRAIKTHTCPDGYIKDNSIIKVLNTSLAPYGVLNEFSEHIIGMNDIESMTNLLNAFWGAVKNLFPKDWELDPKKTRLTHGAGILALSLLMERIVFKKILRKNPKYLQEGSFIVSDFEVYLEPLKDKIDWQNGKYDFNDDGNLRSIMEIQNTSKDIDLFRNFILHQL